MIVGWCTVTEMAAQFGVTEHRVAQVIQLLGVMESKAHARDGDRGREYSSGIVTLIGRELRSRGN